MTAMELQIRKYKPADSDEIKRIRGEIEQTPAKAAFKNIDEHYFVVELDDQVVGYMLSYISSTSFGIEKSAWISMIGIDPKYMGQGIGKQLAEEAMAYFKQMGIHTVYASISWDAIDILSFFKSLGFDRSAFINLKKSLDDNNGAG